MATISASRILRRAGLNRLRSLDPPSPVIRYEHNHPGDLIHFDIKHLAPIRKPGHRITGDRRKESRGVGWEYLLCVSGPMPHSYLNSEKRTQQRGL